jgi:hypothetical protein
MAFVIVILTLLMVSEQSSKTIFSSFSDIFESPELTAISMATSALMWVFWFAGERGITVRSFGLFVVIAGILGLIYLVYMDKDFPDYIDNWLPPTPVNPAINRTMMPAQTESSCQQIDCISVGDNRDHPYLPPTPALPAVN